jgi:hypothetical protein
MKRAVRDLAPGESALVLVVIGKQAYEVTIKRPK